MKMNAILGKTRKEAPSDEVAKNAKLLIRAAFVHKEMAGVYNLLPLGLRTAEKIAQIIKEEMEALGALQVRASSLQRPEIWEKSGRWGEDFDDGIWFKTKLHSGSELGLAFTHEEPLTDMLRNFISSHKDLPLYLYDIRTIFRNEKRAKSGILRGREFYWKAMYSFSKDKESHDEFYEKAKDAYLRVYERVGIGKQTYLTFALGGTFSKYSHEFQTLTEAGEDTVYVNEDGFAINEEAFTDEVLSDLSLSKDGFKPHKMIEVGNIFSLGFKFSEPLGLTYKNESGEEKFVYMGSYGIGITRLMGAIVEVLSDEKGLLWPKSISPFHLHIVSLGRDEQAKELELKLQKAGFDCLLDDRDENAGVKFKDADLIGIPFRVVLSEKAEESGGLELQTRASEERRILTEDELLNFLKKEYEKV